METTSIGACARALFEAHGGEAETEAARKAGRSEEEGKLEEAETWRAVREVIVQTRGAPES